ncbi:MAG TPA: 4'-phosphopantetheinyl transferase superfamily protein [Candidatus Polarisedimenticolaceae bacterium]|nr:4'-phosphopantetheinyl transferase superfamily protein [Candidatus Polarisedimenticolaceae bacterium]
MSTSGFDSPWRDVVVRFVRSACYEDPALALRAASLLSAEERQLLTRLEPDASRLDYLAAHALVRSMIAEMTGCPGEQLQIRTSKDGRSEALLPGAPRGIGFSLSHADGIALCAVASGCSVGADVESERNVGLDPRGFAQVFCTRVELDEISALPAVLRTERLLEIWTFKEAMARATRPRFGVVGSEPHIATVRLLPHHLATIAVVGAPPGHLVAVKFEEYRPG